MHILSRSSQRTLLVRPRVSPLTNPLRKGETQPTSNISRPRYHQLRRSASLATAGTTLCTHSGPGLPGYPVRSTFSKRSLRRSSVLSRAPIFSRTVTIHSTLSSSLYSWATKPQHQLRSPRSPKSAQNTPSCRGIGVLDTDMLLVSRQTTQRGSSFRSHYHTLPDSQAGVHRSPMVLTRR